MPFERDPFGLRSLYTQRSTQRTSSCLYDLAHQNSEPDLDAVLEYLVFGDVWRSDATLFADIARVPPGCRLEGGRLHRAWQAPPATIVDREPRELVEQFWDLLTGAVERALGGAQNVAVALSGGLDSAVLAVLCRDLLGPTAVFAVTEGAPDDPETEAAQATARHLGIEHVIVEPSTAIVDWPEHALWPTAPRVESELRWETITENSLVVWGLGGDSLQRGDRQHYRERLRRGELGRAVADIATSVILHGCKPALGLRHALEGKPAPAEIPELVAPTARPAAGSIAARRAAEVATWRRGVDEMFAPTWSWYFEWMSPLHNDPPIQYAYPFFDVELVEWMSTVPTAPWCVDKNLLRSALRGRIPEHVRLRPKSPVATETSMELSADWSGRLREVVAADDSGLIHKEHVLGELAPGRRTAGHLEPHLRAAAVARWLLDRVDQSLPLDQKTG